MKSLLLVIDVQKAFINKHTKNIVAKIEKIVNSKKYDEVIYTQFINKENSKYINKLHYYGCLNDDQELVINPQNNLVIKKNVYTAFNDELKNYIKKNKINQIYLCGIDTECCILKTAFDLFENDYEFYILKDYCACMHGKRRNDNALTILKRNVGIDTII